MNRTRIKPMSDKRRRENVEYRKIKLAVVTRDRHCKADGVWPEIPCSGYIWDVHHVVSRARAPELRLEPSNLITLCRPHHDAIHANVALATERGLLKSAPVGAPLGPKGVGDER